MKSDYVQHVQTEAGLTRAYSWYSVCNPSTDDYLIDDAAKFDIDFNQAKNRLESFEFRILKNLSKEVINYNNLCLPYNTSVLYNDTDTNGFETINNCTSIANGTKIVNVQEWLPFNPLGQTLFANMCYDIKIEGSYPAKLGETAIDNAISYAGFTFDEFAWWNVSYNSSFTFWLKEPNGSGRTYMPLRINITGLSGKVDNCSNGVLTQNVSGVLTEIPSEIVLDQVNQDGSCYLRFLANLTANENASFVFFTNGSVSRPEYLSGWTPQLWFNQPWGGSAFGVWDDGVVSANGTVVYQGLDMRAGGWTKEFPSGEVTYDAERTLRDRGGSMYIFEPSAGGCGGQTQCKVCMYLNSTDSGDSSQGHHVLYALNSLYGGTEVVVYDYPGVSSTYYGYNWAGPNFISDYGKSKQWIWLCLIINLTTKQVWIGPRSIANDTTITSLIGRLKVDSNGDAGTYHWSKDRMASNNTYYTYNESDYPVFAMGSEKVQGILESEARTAIERGVNSSIISSSYILHSDKQIYARNLSNAQVLGRFDKVAASGNQRWAFNYITGSDTNINMFNITPVLYTSEMNDLTAEQITDTVGKLINSTKQ